MLPVHGDLCTAQRIPWKVPGFSMDFLFREFFTLPRGSHGKSQILPLTFSSQGIHTGQKISWEVQGLGFPMEFFFYRGLYTLTFTDCMHLTDNPLHFNKRDWATCRNRGIGQRAEMATCRNGNVQKGQNVQKWKWRAKQNKTTRPDYPETHIPNNWDEPT